MRLKQIYQPIKIKTHIQTIVEAMATKPVRISNGKIVGIGKMQAPSIKNILQAARQKPAIDKLGTSSKASQTTWQLTFTECKNLDDKSQLSTSAMDLRWRMKENTERAQ